MQYSFGLDIGSTTTELVVVDINTKDMVYHESALSGANINDTGNKLIASAQNSLNATNDEFTNNYIVTTGYGRKFFKPESNFVKSEITEITCYAKGASKLNEAVHTIIDIGGQDSKVICLEDDGTVQNFAMNDKCAAGTGKFLEMIAKQFDITLDQLGELSAKSSESTPISNICAVFAQSEIVNMISKGIEAQDIVKAAEISIVSRIHGMADRLGLRKAVMFCGGVARNKGMIKTLEQKLEDKVYVPEFPDFVGAYGAALFAAAKAERAQ